MHTFLDLMTKNITELLEQGAGNAAGIIGKPVTSSFRMVRRYGKFGDMHFRFAEEDHTLVSSFYLCEMPGCCGTAISYNAFIDPVHRGKALGTLFAELRKKIASRLGYTVMICTEQKILAKTGWEKIYEFNNKCTCNDLNVHIVHL